MITSKTVGQVTNITEQIDMTAIQVTNPASSVNTDTEPVNAAHESLECIDDRGNDVVSYLDEDTVIY